MKLPTPTIVGCALLVSAQAVLGSDLIGHAYSGTGCTGQAAEIKVGNSLKYPLGGTAKSVFMTENAILYTSGSCDGVAVGANVNKCTTHDTACVEIGGDG